jgi:hypothetical protein
MFSLMRVNVDRGDWARFIEAVQRSSDLAGDEADLTISASDEHHRVITGQIGNVVAWPGEIAVAAA